jgi:ubiquinone/menaquinone biosynthesis C-methylase UbiE
MPKACSACDRSIHQTPASYYHNGQGLRAKHRLDVNDSGRSFPVWALNLAPVQPAARILDAGAGWGRFTWPLVEIFGVRAPNIVMLDSSEGMMQTAGEEARQRRAAVQRSVGEIELLPLASGVFDGALANHVLYFMRDVKNAVGELARVLCADGWLLATTNSAQIPVLVIELHYTALTRLSIPFTAEEPSPFSLENGAEILQSGFRQVERHDFVDTTTFASAQEFVALYATTGRYAAVMARPELAPALKQQLLPTYEQLVQTIIDHDGVLRVPKLMGAFVCRGPL